MSTLLITGANRGLGLEFVHQYAEAGWRVLACCRVPGDAKSLSELAANSGGRISLHQLDVADFAAIDALSRQLQGTAIDLLLSNAGIYPDRDHGGFGHIDYEAWAETMRINTMAPLKMAEAFISHLERGSGKTMAAISSKMGSISDNTSGGCYLYRSSKAALNIVLKSLALDLAPHGIRTVVLHPGWVKTDMGGPDALINAQQSVAGMRSVLEKLSAADSGRFLSYDGQQIPW